MLGWTPRRFRWSDLAQLVLLIGDMHVPHRANSIPPKFKKLLVRATIVIILIMTMRQVPGKIQHIICTGNLTSKDMHEYLKTLASDVHVVKGDFDEV